MPGYKDTGQGIAAEQVDRIFDEYRQVGVRDGRSVGTGLGLSLSRAFARMLGGELTVESTVDQGSAFTLEIPAEIPFPCND